MELEIEGMDPDQQVARLEKLIVRLGGFPDRDLIHQITECGRLGLRTGGQALAGRMCAAIMDVLDDGENGATAAERRVPLFYALDSVVKNVGDVFQPLLSVRVRAAFGRAFAACAEKRPGVLCAVQARWLKLPCRLQFALCTAFDNLAQVEAPPPLPEPMRIPCLPCTNHGEKRPPLPNRPPLILSDKRLPGVSPPCDKPRKE